MDQPRRSRGGADRDVVLLDERCPQAPRRRVEQRPAADDPAAHDDDVPGGRRQRRDVGRALGELAASGAPSRPASWRRGTSTGRSSLGGTVRRDMRHSSQPVPTMSTTISERRVEDDVLDAGRQHARQDRGAENDRDDEPGDDDDLAPPGLRLAPSLRGLVGHRGVLSATVGLGRDPDRRDEHLAGVGRAASGQQPGLRPVERDGEVGPDRRVGRLAAREVDGSRRVDGDDRDAAARARSIELDRGSGPAREAAPRTPVPRSASTMTAAFSIPWPNIATSRATGAWTFVMPASLRDAVPVPGGGGPFGRVSAATTATTTFAPCSASRRATT